ncbi:hypothetical protein BDP81DRAFT_90730 [Colletotrichum phormii]|uniref:Uncharacterized protein n=1 Tax=Colletotrichum phormii TaxID=359342 RepID=A0AAJ0A4G9_9PEZI|nr:uncharacterized protein BDP81DRAFT_90730 [Colletotrichum phormii]KAK1654911.1 hypothetical protein BDP81DRAFT_90730 [Colletotrichum phormii]
MEKSKKEPPSRKGHNAPDSNAPSSLSDTPVWFGPGGGSPAHTETHSNSQTLASQRSPREPAHPVSSRQLAEDSENVVSLCPVATPQSSTCSRAFVASRPPLRGGVAAAFEISMAGRRRKHCRRGTTQKKPLIGHSHKQDCSAVRHRNTWAHKDVSATTAMETRSG